jgi:antagonist of KipI
MLKIISPGLHTMVVDQGRPGFRRLGVPRGGAADQFSLALGNALVGNQSDAAALEITLAGPVLEANDDLAFVIFGAPFYLSSDRQELAVGKTFALKSGERLQIGGTPAGARCYLCVQGGFQTLQILGSRSGLSPLSPGAELACSSGVNSGRFLSHSFAWSREPKTLRIVSGLQADWFDLEAFLSQPYEVSPVSNRMGLRLQAQPLPIPKREMVSEAVGPGSVQVTRDGQCIILGVDGQTIGGYPKIAQVISADVDKLGQLRPGDSIRFVQITLPEAENFFQQKQAELDEWVIRLLETSICKKSS